MSSASCNIKCFSPDFLGECVIFLSFHFPPPPGSDINNPHFHISLLSNWGSGKNKQHKLPDNAPYFHAGAGAFFPV